MQIKMKPIDIVNGFRNYWELINQGLFRPNSNFHLFVHNQFQTSQRPARLQAKYIHALGKIIFSSSHWRVVLIFNCHCFCLIPEIFFRILFTMDFFCLMFFNRSSIASLRSSFPELIVFFVLFISFFFIDKGFYFPKIIMKKELIIGTHMISVVTTAIDTSSGLQ